MNVDNVDNEINMENDNNLPNSLGVIDNLGNIVYLAKNLIIDSTQNSTADREEREKNNTSKELQKFINFQLILF